MKKFIYIAVSIILITSLMPGTNYSAPASFLEVTLESPEASQEQVIAAEHILVKRLEAYGVTAFDTEVRPEEREISVRFTEAIPTEAIIPLLAEVGRLEFCAIFTQAKVYNMLFEKEQEKAWKKWLPLTKTAAGESAVVGHIASEKVLDFDRFINGPEASKALPEALVFALSLSLDEEGRRELFALRYDEGKSPLLTGKAVAKSQSRFDEHTGMVSIGLTFTEEGSARWAQATRDNLLRPIAIVFDGQVVFAPRVQTEISSGQAQVTGDFSKEEAKVIAAIIQGGELPAPFQVKEVKQ